ncbi:L-serine ammonia-lyase, iron-sulfur-dependent, subunit beta [Alicyclobacillaceae bacterium I2511]|nr:L-serine ammonia-lyase, iron-sulfur-dependent, subunit beta [Alicyclobacillaceae bacterium I2511]
MKYMSAFEIIGPVMVGPSSSHTAGAVRIGNLAGQLLAEKAKTVRFLLHGSFAETYRGHGTDLALLAGLMGYTTDSESIPKAFQLALMEGLEYTFEPTNLGLVHPNTVQVLAQGEHHQLDMIASSLGGGKAEVQELDGLPLRFSGERPTLILSHKDKPGFIAHLSQILDQQGYNIARLSLDRQSRHGDAITVCEIDETPSSALLKLLSTKIPDLQNIRQVWVP